MKPELQKTRKTRLLYATIACALITIILLHACRAKKTTITQYRVVDRPAKVQPDYAGAVIPPNIAPLNFVVLQEGTGYFMRIYSVKGKPIEIFSKSSRILIPKRA